MTMPHLMNCSHSADGWCLSCVKKLYDERNPLQRIEDQFPDWNYRHPAILYALIRSLKPAVCVEVGTYRGYAACYMAQACKENGKGHVYCIDDFSEGMQKKYDADHWRANIAACELTDYVTLIVGKSQEVQWPETVDFAYIDGWHSYGACRSDFADCSARGAELIAFDDTDSTVGPRQLIAEIDTFKQWQVIEIHRDCGLGLAVKRPITRKQVTFSQELDGPGTILTDMTEKQLQAHLDEATNHTGFYYDMKLMTKKVRVEL